MEENLKQAGEDESPYIILKQCKISDIFFKYVKVLIGSVQ